MRARAPALAFLAAACCGRAAPIPPAVGPAAPTPDAAAIAQLLLSPAGACGVFADGAARCWGEWGGDLAIKPHPQPVRWTLHALKHEDRHKQNGVGCQC